MCLYTCLRSLLVLVAALVIGIIALVRHFAHHSFGRHHDVKSSVFVSQLEMQEKKRARDGERERT